MISIAMSISNVRSELWILSSGLMKFLTMVFVKTSGFREKVLSIWAKWRMVVEFNSVSYKTWVAYKTEFRMVWKKDALH